MTYKYGKGSTTKLDTCHPVLQQIADEALSLSPYDISIIHGLRGEKLQNELYDKNDSEKIYPDSRHNKSDDPSVIDPHKISDALDFAPYVNGDIPWKDTHIFAVVAGCFISAAFDLGHILRWGGDWDSDGSTKDQTLMDWGHVEIMWDYER